MKFGIVADDLTGALDTGLEFWKKGLRTVVVTSPVCVAKYAKRFDAISVDTSSRLSSPRKARGKGEEAARLLRRHGAKFFYKKVDSTLRGNVGAEIEAAMDELRIRTTVLAPSLPEQGRTVVGGELLVGGKPVVETEFGRDPLNPVSESDVKALVEGQTSMKVGSVRLPSVRGNLTRELESLKEGGANIIVADAETRKDLWRIAKSIAEAGLATLSCGSSGLASELPPAFGLRERPPPTIVLSGSL
ncbi:MAG: four-carbon acid sugar kinase family protein, partial [Thermoproteota archaeon]